MVSVRQIILAEVDGVGPYVKRGEGFVGADPPQPASTAALAATSTSRRSRTPKGIERSNKGP
jgi:hypothetical protein